jgi:hypothetical protein
VCVYVCVLECLAAEHATPTEAYTHIHIHIHTYTHTLLSDCGYKVVTLSLPLFGRAAEHATQTAAEAAVVLQRCYIGVTVVL